MLSVMFGFYDVAGTEAESDTCSRKAEHECKITTSSSAGRGCFFCLVGQL